MAQNRKKRGFKPPPPPGPPPGPPPAHLRSRILPQKRPSPNKYTSRTIKRIKTTIQSINKPPPPRFPPTVQPPKLPPPPSQSPPQRSKKSRIKTIQRPFIPAPPPIDICYGTDDQTRALPKVIPISTPVIGSSAPTLNTNKNNTKVLHIIRDGLDKIWCSRKNKLPMNEVITNPLFRHEAITKLIEALCPGYSLGNGWMFCDLPPSIPDYPWFDNAYNKSHNIKKPKSPNYHMGSYVDHKLNDNQISESKTEEKSQETGLSAIRTRGAIGSTEFHSKAQFRMFHTMEMPEFNKLQKDEQIEEWEKYLDQFFENQYVLTFKYPPGTITATNESQSPQITVRNAIIASLMHLVSIMTKDDINKKPREYLLRYTRLLTKRLSAWDTLIVKAPKHAKAETYHYMECIVLGCSYLLHGILIEHLVVYNKDSRAEARKQYKAAVDSLRKCNKILLTSKDIPNIEAKYIEQRQEWNKRRNYTPNSIPNGWRKSDISQANLGSKCKSWVWFSFEMGHREYLKPNDLGKYNQELFDLELGPYYDVIIEAYHRLAWTYPPGSNTRLSLLHRALRILYIKGWLSNTDDTAKMGKIGMQIMCDFAYEHLNVKDVQPIHKYFWFYLCIMYWNLFEMYNGARKWNLSFDEANEFMNKFLIGCIHNDLSTQPEYTKHLCQFLNNQWPYYYRLDGFEKIFNSLSVNGYNNHQYYPNKAVCRLLKLGYALLNHGHLQDANDIYRQCRGIINHYTEKEIKDFEADRNHITLRTSTNRLIDNFEVWWCFEHFCIYAVSVVTSHSIINGDSSYWEFIYDWIGWRNEAHRNMYILTLNNKDHQYHGWCQEYNKGGIEPSKFHLWNAQMLILNVLYSAEKCQLYPNVMYLYLIWASLTKGKEGMKDNPYFDILGYYMQKQFTCFGWDYKGKLAAQKAASKIDKKWGHIYGVPMPVQLIDDDQSENDHDIDNNHNK